MGYLMCGHDAQEKKPPQVKQCPRNLRSQTTFQGLKRALSQQQEVTLTLELFLLPERLEFQYMDRLLTKRSSLSEDSTTVCNSGFHFTTMSTPVSESPYVHQRFDAALSAASALQELSAEDIQSSRLSHAHFVQTATGVRRIAKHLGKASVHIDVTKVMIITKARDNSLVYLTRDMARWLMDRGVVVYVDKKLENSGRFDAASLANSPPTTAGFGQASSSGSNSSPEKTPSTRLLRYWTAQMATQRPELFDLVITLGGDGTVLWASWLFQGTAPPVIPFALGSLGFLTNFEYHEFGRHLTKAMTQGVHVHLRMRFTCTVHKREINPETGKRDKQHSKIGRHEVLNEIVVDRGPSPFISMLELYGDDNLLTIVQADGLILSTPTGSTAYSLSAGGSLVHPEIPAICVTPICPHTLSFRPMLLPDSMSLKVVVPRKNSRTSAWVSFDGRSRVELKSGDYITVRASKYPFPTVIRSDMDYIESVSRTLKWNTRELQKPLTSLSRPASTVSVNRSASLHVSSSVPSGPGYSRLRSRSVKGTPGSMTPISQLTAALPTIQQSTPAQQQQVLKEQQAQQAQAHMQQTQAQTQPVLQQMQQRDSSYNGHAGTASLPQSFSTSYMSSMHGSHTQAPSPSAAPLSSSTASLSSPPVTMHGFTSVHQSPANIAAFESMIDFDIDDEGTSTFADCSKRGELVMSPTSMFSPVSSNEGMLTLDDLGNQNSDSDSDSSFHSSAYEEEEYDIDIDLAHKTEDLHLIDREGTAESEEPSGNKTIGGK